jgi:hypothetical protein
MATMIIHVAEVVIEALELDKALYDIIELSGRCFPEDNPAYKIHRHGSDDEIILIFFDDRVTIECNVLAADMCEVGHLVSHIEYQNPNAITEVIRIIRELAPYLGSGKCP